MPTIDMEYHSKKNISPLLGKNELTKRAPNRSKSYAGILSERKLFANNKSLSFSQTPTMPTKKDSNIHNEDGIFKVEISKDKPILFDGMDTSTDENEKKENKMEEKVSNYNSCDVNIPKTVGSPESSRRTHLSSVCEKSETNENHQCIFNDTTKFKAKSYEDIYTSTEKVSEPDKKPDYISNNSSANTSDRNIYKTRNTPLTPNHIKSDSTQDDSKYRLKNEVNDLGNLPLPPIYNKRKSSRELHMEYEKAVSHEVDELLNQLDHWDFPIFELSEKCNILTQVRRIFYLFHFIFS